MRTPPAALRSMLGPWQQVQGPAHRALADALRLAVLDGRLGVGSVLPSERSLSDALSISRTTVTAAYRRLADEGFISTAERRAALVTLPQDRTRPLAHGHSPSLVDFATASPYAPGPQVHHAYMEALSQLPRYLGSDGYDREGIAELRHAIAQWFTSRGLATIPEQILITHGAQHALSLVTTELVPRRAKVLVEHPSYHNALELFARQGARITVAPPVRDEAGLDEWRTKAADVDLVYAIPDNHNPTGSSMPLWARSGWRTSGWLIIDESMVELGLDGVPCSPLPPLARFHSNTITIGSLSKSVWGGLRIGWIRSSQAVIERLARRRSASDLGNSIVDQLAAAQLITAGHTADEARSLENSRRCDHLRQRLLEELPGVAITRPAGGLALWVQLPRPVAARLSDVALTEGLALSAGPRFSPCGAFQRHLRVPFTHSRLVMDQGTDHLVDLIHRVSMSKNPSY